MAVRAALGARSLGLACTRAVCCSTQALRPASAPRLPGSQLCIAPARSLVQSSPLRRQQQSPVSHASQRTVCAAAAADIMANNPLITVSCPQRAMAGWGRPTAALPPLECRRLRLPLTCPSPPIVPPLPAQSSPFPAYDAVKAEHVVPGIKALLEQLHAEVDALEANVQPTWEGLVQVRCAAARVRRALLEHCSAQLAVDP